MLHVYFSWTIILHGKNGNNLYNGYYHMDNSTNSYIYVYIYIYLYIHIIKLYLLHYIRGIAMGVAKGEIPPPFLVLY